MLVGTATEVHWPINEVNVPNQSVKPALALFLHFHFHPLINWDHPDMMFPIHSCVCEILLLAIHPCLS